MSSLSQSMRGQRKSLCFDFVPLNWEIKARSFRSSPLVAQLAVCTRSRVLEATLVVYTGGGISGRRGRTSTTPASRKTSLKDSNLKYPAYSGRNTGLYLQTGGINTSWNFLSATLASSGSMHKSNWKHLGWGQVRLVGKGLPAFPQLSAQVFMLPSPASLLKSFYQN